MTTHDLTSTVVSRGTKIAVDRYGSGPAIALVGGAFTDRRALAALAQALAPSFTVLAYDRRGRGDSGDTPPYAVAREIEDLAAVLAMAGGPACVFGHSSGAGLAVLAAADGVPIGRLAVYEPPYLVGKGDHLPPPGLAAQMTELASSGRRGEAVEFWMKDTVGLPGEAIAQMRQGPAWPALEAIVATAAYDAMIMAGQERGDPLPAARCLGHPGHHPNPDHGRREQPGLDASRDGRTGPPPPRQPPAHVPRRRPRRRPGGSDSGAPRFHASRRLTNQNVTPSRMAASTRKMPVSMPWKAQNRSAGW